MKIIYLLTEKGWTPFDYESVEAKKELKARDIKIGNEVKIGNEAEIGDGAEIVKSIFIVGSKHTVNWYGTNEIHIGCYKKSISVWKTIYKKAGEAEGYTDKQIIEYCQYIKVCEDLQKSITK